MYFSRSGDNRVRPNERLYPATKNGARPNDRGEIEIVRSGGGKLTPPSVRRTPSERGKLQDR